MSSDPRHRRGALGEKLAAQHMVRLGYRVLERNYRTRWGELDIVAFDGLTLAFCEVNTRLAPRPGTTAFEAVGPRKRLRVRNMARSWLHERRDRPFAPRLRFDVIGVTFDATGRVLALEHLEGAF